MVRHAIKTKFKSNLIPFQNLFPGPDLVSSVSGIAGKLVERLSLRVTGGDLLRQAVTTYIDECSQAKFPVHGSDTVDLWQAILGT